MFMQVVSLVIEFRMKLPDIKGNRQGRIPERAVQMIADHLEKPLTDLLAYLQRAAMPDNGGDVDKAVVRMTVGDSIVLPTLCANA